MAPEIKIPSTYHIKISDLASAEQRALRKANTNKTDCWEPVGAEGVACSIENKDVLDEGEIRAFLQTYHKNEKARSILIAKLPSLVAEQDYEFPVVTKKKFEEV